MISVAIMSFLVPLYHCFVLRVRFQILSTVCCFTTQSVNQIGSKLINNWSKICLKSTKIRPGRALEEGLGAQLTAERGQKLAEEENHGSWTHLGALAWVSSESSTRPRSGPEAVLTRSQMQSACKTDFWRMSRTESLLLKVHWDPILA